MDGWMDGDDDDDIRHLHIQYRNSRLSCAHNYNSCMNGGHAKTEEEFLGSTCECNHENAVLKSKSQSLVLAIKQFASCF